MLMAASTTRPSSLRRSAGALALGVGLLLAGLQPAHAQSAAGSAPDGGFSELPRSEQDQKLQEQGLTRDDLAREDALKKLRSSTDTDFYSTPAQLPAANGGVVRSEPSTFYLDPVKLIKPNASATRICLLYTSPSPRD